LCRDHDDSNKIYISSDFTPSSIEVVYFEALWTIADAEKKGSLAGPVAANFFMGSGLPVAMLREIWMLADAERQNFLTRAEFKTAMRLISMVT
jgi:hypothetical protein